MLNGVSLVIGAAVKACGTYGDPWVSLFSKFIMGIGLWVFQVSINCYPARLSVVCRLTKIARSRVLGIYVCYNYHDLVDIGVKLASVCFKWAILRIMKSMFP